MIPTDRLKQLCSFSMVFGGKMNVVATWRIIWKTKLNSLPLKTAKQQSSMLKCNVFAYCIEDRSHQGVIHLVRLKVCGSQNPVTDTGPLSCSVDVRRSVENQPRQHNGYGVWLPVVHSEFASQFQEDGYAPLMIPSKDEMTVKFHELNGHLSNLLLKTAYNLRAANCNL